MLLLVIVPALFIAFVTVIPPLFEISALAIFEIIAVSTLPPLLLVIVPLFSIIFVAEIEELFSIVPELFIEFVAVIVPLLVIPA